MTQVSYCITALTAKHSVKENQNEIVLAAYLVNETRESFSWLLRTAFVAFAGTVLDCVTTIITDGDDELIQVTDSMISSKIYGGGNNATIINSNN